MNLTVTQTGPSLSLAIKATGPAGTAPTNLTLSAQAQPNRVALAVAVPGSISGPTGPQGPPGPQGQPGSAAGTFQYVRAIPAAVWTINHNLGVYPAIVVADSSGAVVEGDILHVSVMQAVLTFSSAFAGVAYLT